MSLLLLLKLWPQSAHEKGISKVWTLLCLNKSSSESKVFWQMSHEQLVSPLTWASLWRTKSPNDLNVFSHFSHEWGQSLAWDLSSFLLLNTLPHISHEKGFFTNLFWSLTKLLCLLKLWLNFIFALLLNTLLLHWCLSKIAGLLKRVSQWSQQNTILILSCNIMFWWSWKKLLCFAFTFLSFLFEWCS